MGEMKIPEKVVWKYPLPIMEGTVFSLELPREAEIRHFAMDPSSHNLVLAMWVEMIPENEKEIREFQVVGTGERFDILSTYYGTTITEGFVFHLYEIF